jgi:prepilin-type N-terminal cleavage/methylation domain-containing protein
MNIAARHRTPRKSTPGGFTLVELLVVAGIIAVLAGLLLPALIRGYRSGNVARLQQQLSAIQSALEAYKTDFNAYPQPAIVSATETFAVNAAGVRGARLLCKALIAPADVGNQNTTALEQNKDGLDGPGFKTVGRSGRLDATGPVRGPYLNPSRFQYRNADATGQIGPFDPALPDQAVIVDAQDRPILYYPQINAAANIRAATGSPLADARSANPKPMYASDDNNGSTLLDGNRFRILLGDTDANGRINDAETPRFTGPYIIWMAGPDNIFGPEKLDTLSISKVDDVTNMQE